MITGYQCEPGDIFTVFLVIVICLCWTSSHILFSVSSNGHYVATVKNAGLFIWKADWFLWLRKENQITSLNVTSVTCEDHRVIHDVVLKQIRVNVSFLIYSVWTLISGQQALSMCLSKIQSFHGSQNGTEMRATLEDFLPRIHHWYITGTSVRLHLFAWFSWSHKVVSKPKFIRWLSFFSLHSRSSTYSSQIFSFPSVKYVLLINYTII